MTDIASTVESAVASTASPYIWFVELAVVVSIIAASAYGGHYITALAYQKDIAAQAQVNNANTIAAYQAKATTEANQTKITQEADDAYSTAMSIIDFDYSGVQPSAATNAVHSVPIVRPAAAVPGPAIDPHSKVYQLTFKQCDTEEAKFNDLWVWATRQAAAAAPSAP